MTVPANKLLILALVFRLRFATMVPTTGGRDVQAVSEAIMAVLEASSSSPHCSLILLTDGNASHLTLYQDLGALEMSGVGVLEVRPAGLDANQTLQQLSQVVSQVRRLRLSAWCVTVVVASDDLTFLSAFAEISDVGRMMVWTTKLLVVTRLLLPDLQHLQQYWTFSMMNTMFLALDQASAAVRCNLYAHLPYSPEGGRVMWVASWSSTRGLTFLSQVQLFPEKFDNFHGASVNMSVWPFSPYWMEVEETAPDGTHISRLTGRAYIILETISQTLNFTISVLPPNNLKDVMLRIEKRVAFMMPMKLAIMPHLLEKYDYTFIIEEATLSFAMAKPKLKPQWQSFYYPMTDEVWVSILALLFLVPPTLLVIIYGELPSEAGGGGVAGPRLVVQEIFGTLLGQNLSGRLPKGTSTRILLGTWLVLAFIMGAAYRSNLTAFLTVPKYPTRPENLHQLFETDARVTMPPDLRVNFYESFKQSNSSTFKTLVERIYFVSSHDVGLKQAISINEAYIYERLFLKLVIAKNFTERDGSSPLYVARDPVVPGYSAWIIPRDAPYKHNLDHCIIAFHEAGLIRRWSEVVLNEARQRELSKRGRQKDKEADQSSLQESKLDGRIQALTTTHLQGPIFLLFLGLIVAVFAFVVEWVTPRLILKHSQ